MNNNFASISHGNVTILYIHPFQGQKVNEAACDIARQVADEGDALVAGGVSQTPSYLSCKSETEVKKVFQQQLEVFMKKNVDFLIAEVNRYYQRRDECTLYISSAFTLRRTIWG